MVNVLAVPVHPAVTGVTVIVAVTGVVPVFTALNEGIFPVPDAPSPIAVLLFVQLNVVPATGPLKLMAVDGAPLQTVWLVTAFTVGISVIVTTIVRLGLQVGSAGVGERIAYTL